MPPAEGGNTKNPPQERRARKREEAGRGGRAQARRSLLPRALFVAIRLQALSALVLVHLQTTFLFQITHGECLLVKAHRAQGPPRCPARISGPVKVPRFDALSG